MYLVQQYEKEYSFYYSYNICRVFRGRRSNEWKKVFRKF